MARRSDFQVVVEAEELLPPTQQWRVVLAAYQSGPEPSRRKVEPLLQQANMDSRLGRPMTLRITISAYFHFAQECRRPRPVPAGVGAGLPLVQLRLAEVAMREASVRVGAGAAQRLTPLRHIAAAAEPVGTV